MDRRSQVSLSAWMGQTNRTCCLPLKMVQAPTVFKSSVSVELLKCPTCVLCLLAYIHVCISVSPSVSSFLWCVACVDECVCVCGVSVSLLYLRPCVSVCLCVPSSLPATQAIPTGFRNEPVLGTALGCPISDPPLKVTHF